MDPFLSKKSWHYTGISHFFKQTYLKYTQEAHLLFMFDLLFYGINWNSLGKKNYNNYQTDVTLQIFENKSTGQF